MTSRQVSAERGDEVAFLGVDSDDADDAAQTFLDELPLPYPSFTDPDERDRRDEYDAARLPGDRLLRRRRRARLRQARAPYASEADLEADIDKYAIG